MTRSELIEFLEHPTETLAVEIKRWLSPDDPSEAAKIARSLIALRNFDGGILILGLDNEKFAPVEQGRPADLQTAYHSDKLQSLVARHSRPTFEIDVQLIPASKSQVVVIVVPGALRPQSWRAPQSEVENELLLSKMPSTRAALPMIA